MPLTTSKTTTTKKATSTASSSSSSSKVGGAKKKKAAPATGAGATKKTAALTKKTSVAKSGAKTTKKSTAAAGGTFEWPPKAELSAVSIQRVFRGFQARKDVSAVKEDLAKKKAYDDEMAKLRQAAFLMEVELERKEEAKRRKAAEAERKKKAAETKLRKDMLEAAFDGELDDLKALVDQGGDPEYADNHGNTCLSEAAAGGDAATVEYLLHVTKVDPNTKGEFGRTPLWRACFMGKANLIPILLAAGADPRVPNESGETCGMIAASEAIKTTLSEWDVARTESMVAQFEKIRLARANADANAAQAAVGSAKSRVEEALANHQKVQKRLKEARVELERVITEHDEAVHAGKSEEVTRVTISVIHDNEAKVEALVQAAAQTSEELGDAKAELRTTEAQQRGEDLTDADIPGIPAELTDLDDILFKDVGDVLKKDGRWPLIIDPSKQTSVFLRYLDSNYVNACSSTNMERNRLRRSLLGAIRYGKPLVIDVMDVDMWDEVESHFDAIKPGLWRSMMEKSLLENEGYLELVRSDDGEEYSRNNFQDNRIKRFMLILSTSSRRPNDDMVERCYTIRVKLSQKGSR